MNYAKTRSIKVIQTTLKTKLQNPEIVLFVLTGTEKNLAHWAIVNVPHGALSPPSAKTTWVPMMTLLTLDIRANTSLSVITDVSMPSSANLFASRWPCKWKIFTWRNETLKRQSFMISKSKLINYKIKSKNWQYNLQQQKQRQAGRQPNGNHKSIVKAQN